VPPDAKSARRGGVLDPSGIEDIVRGGIAFDRIACHLRAGRLQAISVSTTHVASGRTVIFVQRRASDALRWGSDPTMVAHDTVLTSDHALASAAVPLLFPAVRLEGDFYVDGGLRQNVPLSPARRLGADGLLVINPRFIRDETPTPALAAAREAELPDPFFILGKALNALLLDRIDNDIERVHKLNMILEAGTQHWGPSFVDELNRALGRRSKVRPLDVVHVRASEDIGVVAAQYVQSPEFAKRAGGWIARVLRRIGEGAEEADLLSYVLFDGGWSSLLIEMGRRDARKQHDELAAFFERRVRA
jgi:NTE family protein